MLLQGKPTVDPDTASQEQFMSQLAKHSSDVLKNAIGVRILFSLYSSHLFNAQFLCFVGGIKQLQKSCVVLSFQKSCVVISLIFFGMRISY